MKSQRTSGSPFRSRSLRFETLEQRQMMVADQLSAGEVETLLQRGAAASGRQDAIIAVVDRRGEILGVRVEGGVPIADPNMMIFAIDGAVAKARTAAFFANQNTPITSRTVRFLSQSTVTQREVQSSPNIPDVNSPYRGPGFVAPIGIGGHFPPGVPNTPLVDLLAIEHTNRDSIRHPGPDSIRGTVDDIMLDYRFNIRDDNIPLVNDRGFAKADLQDYLSQAPESYGWDSQRNLATQSRGIATLPGGVPLMRLDPVTNNREVVGGIGVFFPGLFGTADFEQGFVPGIGQTEEQRNNAPLVLQSEWIAFAAAGGLVGVAPVGFIGGIAPVNGLGLPAGRIDLVGITLEILGPGNAITQGINVLQQTSIFAGQEMGTQFNGHHDQIVDPTAPDPKHRAGEAVPDGYLVLSPDGGNGITATQVQQIITQGINAANETRAAIRLPLGTRTRMVLSVTDRDGEVVGLYRMPDATVFSIDVAVAKARNVAYYNDAGLVQFYDLPLDRFGEPRSTPPGVAYSARTFRFLAAPRYPTGSPEGTPPGAFSILNDPGINPLTAENVGAPLPASLYSSYATSQLGFDAFNPGRNFRDPRIIYTRNPNQNGVVFFPGSTALYSGFTLLAGLGVSGDGVDQDDVVTFYASLGYQAQFSIRADQFFIRNVRLPYQKFNRNPFG
ncbi:MAG: hypothetical protein WD894_19590 [Pirellulales bacterium]